MNIVRINLRNVGFVVIALLSSTIKEAHMGYESLASYSLREINVNSTPAYGNKKEELYGTCPTGIPCSQVSADCLKCELTTKCVYGKSYAVNCTVTEQIDCVGDRTFEKKVVCRYCYQTEQWEHQCLQKNSCSSVASPQQHYRTNCTVNDDIVCLGRRRFMKNLPCNWTGGYRWSTALILSITLGGFGADRFYLGHWQEGIGKLFSFGGLGVWTLIDVMLISIRYLGPADAKTRFASSPLRARFPSLFGHRFSTDAQEFPKDHNFWRQRAYYTLPVLFVAVYRLVRTTNVIMPARKGSKRTAVAPAKGAKPAKVIKKKDEFALRPDLRRYKDGGLVLAVGQGDVGQLGLGSQFMEKMRPALVPECQDIVCIAAGGMHSVCLTKAGDVLTFGCNDEGALGRDTSVEDSETTPGLVELDGKAVQVTAGDSHSAALLEDGRVFAWGSFRDSHGNMGLTLKGNERTPVQMLPGQKVAKISSGADHLIFLTDHGYVYTCGCAEQGQLGRICTRSADRHSRRGVAQLLTPSPVQFNRSKNAKAEDVWAGSYCTFVKTYEKGEIHVFGLNNYHQLGMSRAGTYSFPCKSKTFEGRKWKHISSGQHHTLALDEAGQVFVLGRKEYGRLGLGETCEDAKELTIVPDFANLKCIDVAAGSAQSFAITDKGDLYAWGMGSNGQLGTGEEEDLSVPTVIRGKQWMKDNKVAVRVVGGGQHTLILAASPPIKD